MRWQGRRQSGNVLDRRGVRTAGGLGGMGLIIAINWTLLGGNPRLVLDEGPPPADAGASGQRGAGTDARCHNAGERRRPSRRAPADAYRNATSQATAAANAVKRSAGSRCRRRQVIAIGCSDSCLT